MLSLSVYVTILKDILQNYIVIISREWDDSKREFLLLTLHSSALFKFAIKIIPELKRPQVPIQPCGSHASNLP